MKLIIINFYKGIKTILVSLILIHIKNQLFRMYESDEKTFKTNS